ncbi:hypothetical protein [Inquilinus sp. CA228]|uniref:hypothetical protein n=1 Tax=Inquilinus sp. CA228 TaxID=3455609 RepID=UPI003F8D7F0E
MIENHKLAARITAVGCRGDCDAKSEGCGQGNGTTFQQSHRISRAGALQAIGEQPLISRQGAILWQAGAEAGHSRLGHSPRR